MSGGRRWLLALPLLLAACAAEGGRGDNPAFGDSPGSRAIAQALAGRMLLIGAGEGRIDVIALALERGADPDVREAALQRTPLMLAVERGHGDAVHLLLLEGAAVDAVSADGWTALAYAVAGGRADMVRLLVEAGADPERRDPRFGYTPLIAAALLGRVDVIAALADVGADLEAREPATGATPLILAAAGRSRQAPLAVAELLVRGATIDRAGLDGATALIAAAAADNYATAKLLIDSGADVEAANDAGQTPLILAAGRGNERLVRALLAAGADPERRTRDGITAEMAAARAGHDDIARLIGAWPERP